MFAKLKKTYHEFNPTFWVIVFAQFIDAIGGFLFMPFISLYLTQNFAIGLMQAGVIFLIVGLGNMIGGMIGGSLTDKFGRKTMALYGLFISGLFSIVMIFIHRVETLYAVVGIMGLVGSLGGPARGAMIADVLPEHQRAEGYGILRIVANVAATIGPAIGGFLAGANFNWIFIGDAIASALTAVVFFLMVPETKPTEDLDEAKKEPSEVELDVQIPENESQEKPKQTKGGGYREVFRDWQFLFFIGASMLMNLVYMNMNFSLPVYLNNELGIRPQIYGWVISMNAFMVVVLQFFITRRIKKFPALIMIAVGNIFYGIGFAAYGLISSIPMIFVAMIIITIGEMIIAPFGQAIAANFAPIDKRGRYMAVFGFSGLIPMMFGNIFFGFFMDKVNPLWIWWLCGIFSLIAVGLYLLLHRLAKDRFANSEKELPENEERQEIDEISEENHNYKESEHPYYEEPENANMVLSVNPVE